MDMNPNLGTGNIAQPQTIVSSSVIASSNVQHVQHQHQHQHQHQQQTITKMDVDSPVNKLFIYFWENNIYGVTDILNCSFYIHLFTYEAIFSRVYISRLHQ